MFELWKFIVNSKARKSAEKQFHVNNQALHNFSSTLNKHKMSFLADNTCSSTTANHAKRMLAGVRLVTEFCPNEQS